VAADPVTAAGAEEDKDAGGARARRTGTQGRGGLWATDGRRRGSMEEELVAFSSWAVHVRVFSDRIGFHHLR
jgi:hypothetical protein